MGTEFIWILFVVVLALIVLAVFLRFFPIGLWISALASGVHISIGTLVGMRVRRIQPQRLVYPLIKANKAGLDLTISKLETHLLAGGNVDRVINALIAAQRAGIPLEDAADKVDPRDAFRDCENRIVTQAILAQLAQDEREIVVLHVVTGLKHREIAELLEMPLPTVLSKYRRSLKKLERLVREPS